MILLIRIAFYPVTKNLPLYSYSASLCKSICVFMYTAHYVVTFWFFFAKYLSLYAHFHIHIQRQTHTGTRHVYNQQTRRMATTGHSNLVERGERNSFVRDNGLAHTQIKQRTSNCQGNSIFTNLKQKIRAHRASCKGNILFLTK